MTLQNPCFFTPVAAPEALTPLIREHVNPYGRFALDMDARLPLD